MQLRMTSADPIEAEIVGYSSGPESNQLDAAMIPLPPGDVEIRFEMAMTGRGSPVIVTAIIVNTGATPASGYQLRFGPDSVDSRVVEAPPECVVVQGQFRCGGGPLQPGEDRRHSFDLHVAAGGVNVSPVWTGSVELNEVDLDPSNNTSNVPPPAPIVVDMRTDVKARVIDDDGDGKATPGEIIEVYVVAMNDGTHTLSNVTVGLSSMFWESVTLEGDLAPGERRAVRFERIIPSYGAGDIVGIMSSMDASVGGATATTASNALMVIGESVTPNPEGANGDQPDPVGQWDPLAPPTHTMPEGPGEAGSGAEGSGSTDAVTSGETSSLGQADAQAEGSAEGSEAQASGSATSESGVHPGGEVGSGGKAAQAGESVSATSAGASADPGSDGGPADAEASSAAPGAQAAGQESSQEGSASVRASAEALSRTGSERATGLMAIMGLCLVLGLAIGGAGVRRARNP